VLVVLAAFATLVPAGRERARGSTAPATARPNVLVVVVDDQRLDLLAGMTRTRAYFVDGGTTFTHTFDETPLCCPSRATILTGRFTHNHGVTGNTAGEIARLDHATTVASYLHDSGYQTGIAGKLFNAWDLTTPPPGFDTWAVMQGGYENATFAVDGSITSDTGYSTEFIERQALRMLDRFEQDDAAPWFLYVAPFAPHWPYTPAPRDAGVPPAPFPPNPAMLETDRTDKPPAVQARAPADLTRAAAVASQQLAAVRSVDRMVDALVTRMRELGEDNVLAVYVSDNGYLLGEHGVMEDKRLPYDMSVRVPMMLRWPGHVAPDAVDARLVTLADITPTILDAADVPPSAETPLDGHSLLSPYSRGAVFIEQFPSKETPFDPGVGAWASVRTNTIEYIEWYANAQIVFRELYDLTRDPWELDNLAVGVSPDRGDIRAYSAFMARQRGCRGAAGAPPCV
jgi:arylsulfatase A-like enzyme